MIAFITSQFPEIHETFIAREFYGLSKAEVPFLIYSLKRCQDRFIQKEALPLLSKVIYIQQEAVRNFSFATFFLMLSHPLVVLQILFKSFYYYFKKPYYILTTIFLIPSLIYFCYREIPQKGITHIHAHWATVPSTFAMFVHFITGIPYSITAHAWDIYKNDGILSIKLNNAKFVISCTSYNCKYLRELTSTKVLLNYHGVDLSLYDPKDFPSNDIPLILSVGRLVEQKGFIYLIECIDLIVHKYGEPVICKIIGDGPLRKELEKMILKYKLDKMVFLEGALPHEKVIEYLRNTDIFVLPCVIAKDGDRDGIPNVILEAMAMKIPVVSTNISGIPEAVKNNVSGYTVPQRDSSALAEVVFRLLKDEILRKKMGANGRKIVEEKFDINKNVKQLIEIFKRFST